jgi:hypothetical protein
MVSQAKSPILVVDADHRWSEVNHLVSGSVFTLSGNPLDNIDPDKIAELIRLNIRDSGVKSIILDSLTPIIAERTIRAFRNNLNGTGGTNRVAGFADKATAVRLLQDTLTGTGADVYWIFHIYEGRDAKAAVQEKTSISTLELARILRSCNLRVRISNERGVYTATVVWARNGRSGVVIQDQAVVGSPPWTGVMEKIEAAVYDNLSPAEQEEIEKEPPAKFPSAAEAIHWAMDQNVGFKDEAHAQNAYNLVKEAKKPASALEMRNAWVAEIQARKDDGSTVTEEERATVAAAREATNAVENA